MNSFKVLNQLFVFDYTVLKFHTFYIFKYLFIK